MAYHRLVKMILMQPFRFLINCVMLIICVIISWSSLTRYQYELSLGLTISCCLVLASGIFHQLELLCYFYFGDWFFLSKAPETKVIELESLEASVHSPIIKVGAVIEKKPVNYENNTTEEIKPLIEATQVAENDNKIEENTTKEAENDNNIEENTTKEMTVNVIDEKNETSQNEESINNDSIVTNDNTIKQDTNDDDEKVSDDKEDENEEDDTEDEMEEKPMLDISEVIGEPKLNSSVSDTTGLVDRSFTAAKLTTQMSVRSMDGSCFFNEEDLEIIDLNSTLTKEDVKQAITDIQEQGGKVTKEKFINTMMDFFPRYNIEENKNKLSKLFDRLDKHDEQLINFRQFMLVAIAFSSVALEDKLTRIFKLIDENGDDELSYEEFEEIVKDILVLKEERKMSQTLVEERFSQNTFRDMGMNQDGKVNLVNFVEACTRQKFIIINYVDNFRDGFLINSDP